MPPRKHAQQPAMTLFDLPEEVLARIVGLLSQRERLSRVALVCRRFHALCTAPELLRSVCVGARGARVLPAARSLLLWLTRHAAHIRDLTISFEEEAIADRSKLEALVHACLGACAAGGALEALQVQGVLMRYLAWLPALRSLQLVLVDSWQEEVMLPVGTEALTQLLCMELSCNKLSFEPSARLPPSLVTLRLMDESTEMPPQVAAVCGLRHLTIEEAHYSSESMAALSRLTGLTHLDCNHCHHLPPDLGVLTTLRNLYLHLRVESPAAQLDPHLQRLQQLTCLVLRGVQGVPQSLGSLPLLERLYLADGQAAPDEVAHLPHGLRSLRWLGAQWLVLANSVDVLAAATQLEWLCIADHADIGRTAAAARGGFWRWASTHPPLQRLVFTWPDMDLIDDLLLLCGRRPALVVCHDGSDAHPAFLDAISE